jgi:phosphatidylglycerol:prolipoprotein diacylglycerol transferase
MLQPFFDLGGLTFRLYGIFIAIGFLFLYFYAIKNCSKYLIKKSQLDSAFIVLLLSSLLGARVYHVLSWLSYYKLYPIEILYFWQGGLGIFGAILGSAAGILIYGKLRKLNVITFFNLIAPSLLITQAIGRIGNFFNHEGFGPPTNLPWGVFIPVNDRPIQYIETSYFHPVFFYESILCLIAFAIFLIFRKKIGKKRGFSFYLISYGLIRLFTESFRFDTWDIYGIKVAYIFASLFIFLGVFLNYRNSSKSR